jgi:microcystin degradation protein MlrC
MRIALGEIVQETGTFTPALMGLEAFESYGLYQGDELLRELPGVGPPGGFLRVLQEQAEQVEQVEVVPLARAWAQDPGFHF